MGGGLDEGLARRAEAAGVARLATVDPAGRPHVVPCCFAVEGDIAYTAVDHKPKRSVRLARLDHVRANPAVSLLVDHYEDDWSALWWVRLDGRARVEEDGPVWERGRSVLAAKYPQYRDRPPVGPMIVIDVGRRSSWSAAPDAPPPSPPASTRPAPPPPSR